MGALPTELRNQLSKACVAAREAAEGGARSALQALAVHHHEPYGSMTREQRTLRNRLRAHGRQLGDNRDSQRGTQTIGRLVHECAYEHWHRMLFARFLAENHLLIEPSSGVAITMEECEELARESSEDPWTLAGRFAQRMLPQIFRPDDPVLEVALPPETRQELERLLADLPSAVFTADDALGWTYQFWQFAEKDRVNASGEKVTGATLPAVTQLFTEHYMVLFLLHNAIGAWHAGKVLAQRPDLAEGAASEQELRDAVGLDGYNFEYLRFVREPREGDEEDRPTGPWRPAAGTFDGWPKRAADLTVLDPCCGSGHFLVEAFFLLVRLRVAEEGMTLEDAIPTVMRDNLFGLELDARCTQIAAFNLALAAWRLIGKVIPVPDIGIACSGLAPNATKREWLELAERAAALGGMPVQRDLLQTEESLLSSPLKEGMEALYDLFMQAPELGSLIDPERATRGRELLIGDFTTLRPLLVNVLATERGNDEAAERAAAAQGMAKAAEILVGPPGGYTLVATNVPYLGSNKQSASLQEYIADVFPEGKADLSAAFILRINVMLSRGGTSALVTPQNWITLSSFKRLRRKLLRESTLNLLAALGPSAFSDMNWWAANTLLSVFSATAPDSVSTAAGLDASAVRETSSKGPHLKSANTWIVPQIEQFANPDHRIVVKSLSSTHLMSRCADFGKGSVSGDAPHYVRYFWETDALRPGYRWWLDSPALSARWAGRQQVILWAVPGHPIREERGFAERGQRVWRRQGVAISKMNHFQCTLYDGELFDDNCVVLSPHDRSILPILWKFCSSPAFKGAIREVESKLAVTAGTFVKIPFDVREWIDEPSPELGDPQSNDPTQWLFHGRAEASSQPLHVAMARLSGYRWPPELDPDMRLSVEARASVESCAELGDFSDKDGIVCIWPVRGEAPGADRLRALLAATFGNAWLASKDLELLQAAANEFNKGKLARSLEDWLVERFFEEHCRLFHHRPFVWQIWDGRSDGFNALVNYHRLAGPNGEGRRTLDSLTYTYLGDWIERQRADQRDGKEGADARLAAALDLQEQLKKILAGEPPYDIFVRWKPLHEQPIGWEPDINDGIRLNIRPFLSASLRKGGKKGAGILRVKPNIDWKKDRGKEPESLRPKEDFPWFWSCDPEKKPEHRQDFLGGSNFDGNRWNDLHYSSEVKRVARERKAQESRKP